MNFDQLHFLKQVRSFLKNFPKPSGWKITHTDHIDREIHYKKDLGDEDNTTLLVSFNVDEDLDKITGMATSYDDEGTFWEKVFHMRNRRDVIRALSQAESDVLRKKFR